MVTVFKWLTVVGYLNARLLKVWDSNVSVFECPLFGYLLFSRFRMIENSPVVKWSAFQIVGGDLVFAIQKPDHRV